MAFTYKELIEVAIGSPESGHVNFYALQVLLTCFAQRLEVLDKVVVQDDYMMNNVRFQRSLLNLSKSRMPRMFAGADAEEDAPAEAPAEEPAPPAEAEEVPPVNEAEEAPPLPQAEEAPPLPQVEDATAEEIAKTEPTEDVPELEPEPAASRLSQEAGAPASQPEPEPSQGSHEAMEDCLEVSAVPSQVSHISAHSMNANFRRLDERLKKVELYKERTDMEMNDFIPNLKGQVKIIVKQLDIVAHMMIDQRQDPQRIKLLRQFSKQLRVLMRAADEEISIGTSTDEGEGAEEELGLLHEEVQEESSASTVMEKVEEEQEQEFGLKCLVYSPSRMLNELLDNKALFCALNSKVNDLTAAFQKQETQKLFGMINDLQATVREVRLYMASNIELNGQMMARLKVLENDADLMKKTADQLDIVKSDREEMEHLLAEKPNFEQLATKMSLEQHEEFKVRLDMKFCEIQNIIGLNEKNVLQIIDNLRITLGIEALELSFKDFREMIERKVHTFADALQKYIEMTNDDCAAAVAKVKVMNDLACLSCDTECVMRTVERSKVPTLPKAKGSNGLGPLITYELGQIRKSGAMGYYRKDEYPQSTSAWAKGISAAPMAKCTQRRAGGTHTIHTAEEHMQKVLLSKKTTVLA
ncbi:hypothetical protein KR059_001618 [Drosophila kikkawai]|nr:hypothetical protein KR059_001618 [Drosophila kikkawai]